jgi:hypothetical protein
MHLFRCRRKTECTSLAQNLYMDPSTDLGPGECLPISKHSPKADQNVE